MSKVERRRFSRIAVVVAGSLSAHVALAAVPDQVPGQWSVTPATAAAPLSDPVPVLTPAVVSAEIDPVVSPALETPGPDLAQIECVAKVIRHEAANQPEEGQVAVAQVIRARMKDGRFPTTACGVVKQRGQFFDVDAYDPPRDDARWTTAVRIAAAALQGGGEEVAEGALFFHSAGASMPGRTRIAKIADHYFYR